MELEAKIRQPSQHVLLNSTNCPKMLLSRTIYLVCNRTLGVCDTIVVKFFSICLGILASGNSCHVQGINVTNPDQSFSLSLHCEKNDSMYCLQIGKFHNNVNTDKWQETERVRQTTKKSTYISDMYFNVLRQHYERYETIY